MLELLLTPIFSDSFTGASYCICLITSLLLGGFIALCFSYGHRSSRNFQISLIMLPAIVQTVIMLVNGNVGTGVAVMGAFSLVRFRSAPGNAREITAIFLAMAAGLACSMGYLGLAVLFVLVLCLLAILFTYLDQRNPIKMRELKITVPETLNYVHAFDEVFETYTQSHTLVSAKTSNMGSLYRLQYHIVMKNDGNEQAFIDALRCKNGNLEIMLGISASNEEIL